MKSIWASTRSQLCLAICVFSAAQSLFAQTSHSWPARPLRVVIPYPPGGGGDAVGRTIAQPLSKALHQPVIADNRGGAGGLVATDILARATPDGYTLLLGDAGSIAVSRGSGKLAYDPVKDFAPVILVGSSVFILVVRPSPLVNSVKELIALAKAKPGKLTFASAGSFTAPHMAAELFRYLANVQMLHVPYKGGAPAITAVVGGEADMYFSSTPAAAGQIKAGRLRALGVTGSKRKAEFPDVPTIAETVPGYDVRQWYGVFAPAGTPSDIVNKLHTEIVNALGTSEVQKRLAGNGVDVAGSGPSEFSAMIAKEIDMWSKVVKQAGIRPD